jgi:nucleotide-binding universal stress UspA family protein
VIAAVAADRDSTAVVAQLLRLGQHPDVLVVHMPRLVPVRPGAGGPPHLEVPESTGLRLASVAGDLAGHGLLARSQPLARSADPAGAIAHTAETWGADLVVVGSRRLDEVTSVLFGSVSRALARRSVLPVLVAAPA